MLSDIQFKGLYTGRLTYVEQPKIIGLQLLGVVFFKFKSEMDAEQRVLNLALLQKIKNENISFSLVLVFPDQVEFSGIDMNNFKEIYILARGMSSQFSIVCGLRAAQKLKSFGRTKSIDVFSNIAEALLHTKPQYLMSYKNKMSRNIIVVDSNNNQRETIVTLLLKDRFSAVGVSSFDEAYIYIEKFGAILDGAVFELNKLDLEEKLFIERFRVVNPNAIILIHSDMLDENALNFCKTHQVNSAVKNPSKLIKIIREFKSEFPERKTNSLGFTE